jgi:hypothetical protein
MFNCKVNKICSEKEPPSTAKFFNVFTYLLNFDNNAECCGEAAINSRRMGWTLRNQLLRGCMGFCGWIWFRWLG